MTDQTRKPPKLPPKSKAKPESKIVPEQRRQKASGSSTKDDESSPSNNASQPDAPPADSDVSEPKPPNAKKLPKLGPRQKSTSSATASSRATGTTTPQKTEARRHFVKQQPSSHRPSAAQRKTSKQVVLAEETGDGSKARKLPPKQGDQEQTPSARNEGVRRPSLKSRQSSVATKSDTKGGDREEDLKSALSDNQRKDLGELVVGITNRMRRNIEDNFDSYATLTRLARVDDKKDPLESLDFDPGSVNIDEYDKERKLRDEREKELSSPKVKALKDAAIHWFDDWRVGFLKRVDEALEAKGQVFRQPKASEDEGDVKTKLPLALTIDSIGQSEESVVSKVEDLYPRVGTSLTKISMAERTLILHSMLLLLLSLEHYNATSRVFLLYLASSLKLGFKNLREDEEKVAKGLLEAAKQISIDQDALKKGKENQETRKWKIRLATVAGAAIVGVTGGYAAPVIAAGIGSVMGGLGLEATAAAGYLGSMAGNTYLVGSLFGAYGGRMTGDVMKNLSADVEDFGFLPVHGERKEHEGEIEAATGDRRLRVVISVSGWLLEKEEVITPWRVLNPSAEVFALRFELEALMKFGQSIKAMSANDTYGIAHSAFKNRAVVTDFTSNIWPLALIKLARVIENPFSIAKARADKAGRVLAEALMDRVQGERPVTLIGYSVGARVIWSCLMILVERKAFGFVESAVFIGSPIPSDITTWRSMRTVVSGRLVNVYSKNDYLLAFLHRVSSLEYQVAGLRPIEGLPGIENVDVSAIVTGHLRYRYLVGPILQKIRFEDVNKDVVTKEVKAFKIIVEEEKKHDYVQDAKDDAGDMYKPYLKQSQDLKEKASKLYEQSSKLYEQYGGTSGKKDEKKAPSADISDADAENQVSAMEKDVDKQTQKGLMQWAVEQLYISRPSVPSAEDVKDPNKIARDTTKTANKQVDAATKSLYQRAKEAVYLSRSGGPEGEDLAKVKSGDIKDTADSAMQKGYLASAADYIPTGYIPYMSGAGDTKDGAKKATQQAGTLAENVPIKPQTPGSPSTPGQRQAPPKLGSNRKESIPKLDSGRKGSIPKLEKEQSKPSASKYSEKASDSKDTPSKSTSGGGVTSYIPKFGFGSGSKNDNGTPSKDKKSVDSKKEVTTKPTEVKETPKKLDKNEGTPKSGYGSYIPHFGFGGGGPGKDKGKDADEKAEKADDESEQERADQQNLNGGKNEAQSQGDNAEKTDNVNAGQGQAEKPEETQDASKSHGNREEPEAKQDGTEAQANAGANDSNKPDDDNDNEDDKDDEDPERTPTGPSNPHSGLQTPAEKIDDDDDESESRPTTRDSKVSKDSDREGTRDQDGDPFQQ